MGKNVLWLALGVIALIFVGWIVLSLLGTLLKLAFYLLIGALVVGGVVLLVRRAKGAVRDGKFKQLR